MHVDNWNPDTFLWILQECDVPYVPDEWSKLLEKYASDPSKVTGMTILGRYLSKMKLKQFKDYRWKDTEFLQEVANNRVEQAMKRQGYGAAEIAQQLAKTNIEIPEEGFKEPVFAAPPTYAEPDSGGDDYFGDINGNDSELVSDLTEEDKTYLRLKWGKAYKPEEWVRLEQLYQEMKQSYDVQGAGHEDVLKLVCKTSLKANQLLDIGDVDGAQKMVKMYDSLMKSGKFTAAQNKAQDGEFVDSISELDLKNYTHSLITDEMNLGNLIENAVKEMATLEAKEEDEDIEDELTYDNIEELTDEDFGEFNEFLDSQSDDPLIIDGEEE